MFEKLIAYIAVGGILTKAGEVNLDNGEEVAKTSPTELQIQQTIVNKITYRGGSGYAKKSDIDQLNIRTVPIPANFAGLEAVMIPTRLKDQLFEIVDVDEEEETVTITARHIWYSNIQNNTLWKPTAEDNYTAAAVCRNILTNAVFPSDSNVASDCTDTKPGKDLDFERKNLVEAFLDPEKGVCKLFGLSLIRDNMDFYVLKNVGYDRGFIVERGKNMLGIERQENIENLATRVAPIAKDSKGNIVWMNHNGLKYIDSQYINNYSSPRLEIYDTGLQIGKDGVTTDNIQAKLLEAAQKRFSEDEVDKPEVTMTIEFISLGDTEEYKQYRDLDKVYLYDILTVKDEVKGYNYSAQVIGVEHDILTGRLNSVTIGSLKQADATRKIAVWQVPEINGENIRLLSIQAGAFAPGAIGEDDLQEHIIKYAHFASATIDSLNSAAITAITAEIETIIAGHITAESIKASAISSINATLGTATITNGVIDNADIGWAHIQAATAESLIAHDAVTDRYYINKLQVTNLQAVNATVGGLVIKASDNKYYRLDIDENGELQHTEVAPTSAQIAAGAMGTGAIIETDLTVQDLAAANVKAINVLIDKLTASRIDVDELFARTAFINKLNTTNIESTANLTIKTGGSFTVQSGNFSVNSSGNVYMSGEVHAGANSVIGGWTLGANRIYSGSGTGYVAMDSDTSGTYAIWAGHGTAASAPFSVTRDGALKTTSGTIGGFTIGASQLSAGSGTNSVGLDSGTANFDYAMWAGNATASSAPFRLKRDGTVTLTKLMVLGEDSSETEVNLRTAGLWKLSYATVKSISVSGNTLTISTTAGTTTFSKAATTAHLVGSWGGKEYTVYADNDPDVISKSSGVVNLTNTGASGKNASIRAYTTGEIVGDYTVDCTNVWNAGYDAARGYVTMPSAGTGTSFTVKTPNAARNGQDTSTFTITKDTASAYGGYASVSYNSATVCRISISDWWTGGANSVTVSAAGWQNGKNRVTASNSKYVDVSLPSFSTSGGTSFTNHKTTVYFSTASVTGALASKEVDATSEYNSGWTGSYQAVTLSATGTKSLTYGESVTVYPRAKASASSSAADITTISYKITAPADRYQTGYTAGYTQGHVDGVDSVTVYSVGQNGTITYSSGNYSVPVIATASNSETKTATISFSGSAAYNAGWNACLDACGFEGNSFYQGATPTYLYSGPMIPAGNGRNYNVAYGYTTVPARK